MSEFLQESDKTQAVPQTPTNVADQPFLVQGERVFKSPEEVATKLESADAFIAQLKAENEAYRTQLAEAKKVEDVLEAMKREPTNVVQPVVKEEHTNSTNELSVEQMVQNAMANAKALESADANMANARGAFTAKFGEKSSEVYKSRLEELNMADDVATALAKTAPEAFKRLFVGEATAPQQNHAYSSPGVNTTSFGNKPAEVLKVHQIKDKQARLQEIQRRISETAKKYQNG